MTDDDIAKLAQGFWERLTWAEAAQAANSTTSYKFNVMGFARAILAAQLAAPVLTECRHCGFRVALNEAPQGAVE